MSDLAIAQEPDVQEPGLHDPIQSEDNVSWVVTGPDGEVKAQGTAHNLITRTGAQMYAERGAGVGTVAAPTGMKLGTGTTAVAKTGAGSFLTTYVANSHQAFSGTPGSALQVDGRRITYTAAFAAGKATTASAIAEAVIVNEVLTDATSLEAATVARVLLTPAAPKGANDTLTLTWTHDIG